jgi:hypothetical protein
MDFQDLHTQWNSLYGQNNGMGRNAGIRAQVTNNLLAPDPPSPSTYFSNQTECDGLIKMQYIADHDWDEEVPSSFNRSRHDDSFRGQFRSIGGVNSGRTLNKLTELEADKPMMDSDSILGFGEDVNLDREQQLQIINPCGAFGLSSKIGVSI